MDGTEGSVETTDGASEADSNGEGGPPLGAGHGVVVLELRRGDSQVDDPFVGTTRVEVTLLYRDCLIGFYEANPDWRQVGVEGSAVFEAVVLENTLCEAMDPLLADCTVTQITQELDVTKALTVAYDVTGALENRELHFGPLPDAALAACPDGGLPIVRVGSVAAVRGFDVNGTGIWATESFSPAEAATDQGGAISIRAARI